MNDRGVPRPTDATRAEPPMRVAIAASSPLVRAGLRRALVGAGGIDVVAEAPSFAALRDAGFGDADAAIVDSPDDGGDAVGVDPDTLEAPSGAGTLAVVVLADPADERVGEWLIDGVSVLPRSASPATIAGALQAALAGLVATPPAYAAEALRFERVGERRPLVPGIDALTRREREVLEAMSQGLANREIGAALGISAHTAKFHVAQIIAKLQVQSRAHAVARAMKAGVLDG